MKKQILTLTMCVALTATATLAEGTKSVTKAPVKTAVTKVTPAKASTAKTTQGKTPAKQTVAQPAKPEPPKAMTREEARKYFEEKRAKDRENLYNALGLSPEQKVKAEALDKKTIEGAEPLVKKARNDHKKLKDLKEKHASIFAIWMQEHSSKSSKIELKKHFDSSKKQFEAILTTEQKAKFKNMEEARHKQIEAFRKDFKKKGLKHRHEFGPGPDRMGPPPPPPAGEKPVGPPPPIK